jgi:hypothetical protein
MPFGEVIFLLNCTAANGKADIGITLRKGGNVPTADTGKYLTRGNLRR